MALFSKAISTQAYLKAGFMGFAGAGKTYTAAGIAIGLIQMLRSKSLPDGNKPVFFLDTETGSDYVADRFKDAGIEMSQAKTRAFVDLVPAVKEAEANGSVLIIDSITHFWREFTEAYAKKRNRTRGLEFQDWAYLKQEWGKFTDAYINSAIHIVMCGRAGYEYDFFTNDNGKRELEKTGIKMKAETETGYEPSLLVLMERSMDMDNKKVYREAHVLKERFDVIDGSTFKNPTFADFLPHIERLNLGGAQLGVQTERTSEDMIRSDGKQEWQYQKEQAEIALDEVGELIRKHHGGQSEDAKRARGDMLEKHFGTRSWKRVETMKYDEIKKARASLWVELEGVPYGFVPPQESKPEEKAGGGFEQLKAIIGAHVDSNKEAA